MKLLVVSHSCATPVNQQLYAEIRKRTGWDVTIIVPSNWRDEFGNDLPVKRWPAFDGELIGIPVFLRGNIVVHAYRASFTRLIERINPDVIYVNHEPYAIATAQVYWGNRRAGRRPIGFYSCQNIHKRYPLPFRCSESRVLSDSHFAFPISTAVDRVFRDKGYRGASTILPLAIDTDLYRPRPQEAIEIRKTLAPNGEALIGFVGRFVPEKGLRTLIEAAAGVSGAWRLALIGAGSMEQELRDRVTALGLADRVAFVGFIPHDQTPAYLSALDVLVLPSETQTNWKEQFGRVLLESMACGTPVLGSDSGEIPTLIAETGGGLTFREQDAKALAAQLSRLIEDSALQAQLAAAGREAVQSRYSIELLAQQFINTIDTAASSNRISVEANLGTP